MPTDRRPPHERYGVAREDQLHSARTFTAVLLVAALLLLLGGVAHGQYVVAPDGTGDFDDLQTALDAVPAGATVTLAGHLDPTTVIRITRSVRLRGELAGSADAPTIGSGVEVDAPAADVVLEGLAIGGDAGATTGDAVTVRAARSVTLRACRARGGPLPGGLDGGAGLRVVGPVDYLHLAACDVAGHATTPDCRFLVEGGDYSPAMVGGPGMVLPVDLVGLAALDACLVAGGSGGWLDYAGDPATDLDPPGPMIGGDGGPALVGDADARACAFLGGAPGDVFGDADDDGYLDDVAGAGDVPVAAGHPGADVLGTVRDRVRGTVQVAACRGGDGTALAVVGAHELVAWYVATDLVAPLRLRRIDGQLQLLPPWLTAAGTADAAGLARLDADVPDDPALDGLPVFVQAFAGRALTMLGATLVGPD